MHNHSDFIFRIILNSQKNFRPDSLMESKVLSNRRSVDAGDNRKNKTGLDLI